MLTADMSHALVEFIIAGFYVTVAYVTVRRIKRVRAHYRRGKTSPKRR